MSFADYFESVKNHILADSFVEYLIVVKERDRSDNGHLRIRIFFRDESMLEFSEYLEEGDEKIALISYSYHWIDKYGKLRRRWDNTPHFPKLANFPNHIHTPIGEAGEEVTPGAPTNIFAILDEIAKIIGE